LKEKCFRKKILKTFFPASRKKILSQIPQAFRRCRRFLPRFSILSGFLCKKNII